MPLVEVNTTAAREHVPEIERRIRTIKERVQATTSHFPFNAVPKLVLIQTVYTICLWLNAVWSPSGKYRGLSPQDIVTGRGVDYNKDCRADLGGYVEARPDKVVTNDNTPRTHACIALGPSGNRQGSLKCFDLKTGKVVVRRVADQIPWPESMIKIASAWSRKSKKLIMKDSVQFLNRKGENFDWGNVKLSKLKVEKNPSKMIHPDILAELSGIEFQRNLTTPSRVTVRREPHPLSMLM